MIVKMLRLLSPPRYPLSLLLALLLLSAASAFTTSPSTTTSSSGLGKAAPTTRREYSPSLINPIRRQQQRIGFGNIDNRACYYSTKLNAAVGVSLIRSAVSSAPSKVAVTTIATFVAALLWGKRRHRILYRTDPDVDAPLPDGSYRVGCPFVGANMLGRDVTTGMSGFFSRMSRRLGNPRVWKSLVFGKPIAVVSGSDNVRQILGNEFKTNRVAATFKGAQTLMGWHNLFMAQNDQEHAYLRKLIGQSMTPESIALAVPTLQALITDVIDKVAATAGTATATTTMEDVCTEFTLDVAHAQILGLDLDPEEIPEFRRNVDTWIWGTFSPRILFLPFPKLSKAYRARMYLVNKIQRKIDKVRRDGPDGSTLGAMVTARDDESGKQQRLTDEEIIDNALLLILAGSETSASTLTNAVLFLGLHPDVFDKVKAEQADVLARYGGNETITRPMLDKEFPYLESVIKETMRIRPLQGGAMRNPTETIVVDGKQIPPGMPVAVSIQLTHELDPVTNKGGDGSSKNMDIMEGFKPERWLDPDTRPSSDFVPFGWGVRYCLGANLAMAEMKLFLAVFARKIDSFQLVNYGSDEKDGKSGGGRSSAVRWKRMSIIPKPQDGTVISVTAAASLERKGQRVVAA